MTGEPIGDTAILLVPVLAFLVGGGLVALVYRQELRGMARTLNERSPRSGTRITCNFSDSALEGLGKAIETQLDERQAERLAREKDLSEFNQELSSFSHDVRTPLMGAKGYLQLARKSTDPDAEARLLSNAESRIDNVRELLDQLYLYMKASDPESRYCMQRNKVLPILMNALFGEYPLFESRGWEPTIRFEDEGLAISCDEVALGRIFENLVSNALKYGSSAPLVTQHGYVVTMENDVANPDAIDVSRLFDRFYQADASRSADGSGLGLATVSQLAHGMGMDVTAEVRDGVFRIALDLFPERSESALAAGD
jgi:signal transduction histidine kinase